MSTLGLLEEYLNDIHVDKIHALLNSDSKIALSVSFFCLLN